MMSPCYDALEVSVLLLLLLLRCVTEHITSSILVTATEVSLFPISRQIISPTKLP